MSNETLKSLDVTSYPPVGRCICCVTTEGLDEEHILPIGGPGELHHDTSSIVV